MIEYFGFKVLKDQTSEAHPKHQKYSTTKPAHEAGFDSYLTAKVLIRLAAKLEAAGPGATTTDKSLLILSQSGQDQDSTANHSGHSDTSSEGVPLPAEMLDISSESEKNDKLNTLNPKRRLKGLPSPTAFSHPTIFGVLADAHDEDSSGEDLIDLGFEEEGFKKSPKINGTATKRGKSNRQPPPPKMMPPFQSEFWDRYRNKLRVNGTLEEVCHLKAEESGNSVEREGERGERTHMTGTLKI